MYYFCRDIMPGNKLIVNYWIPPKADPEFYNFGDDLNRILGELISGKRVIPYKYAIVSRLLKKTNYLCIGSVVSQLTNEQTVIWGGGVLSPEKPLAHKPLKVLAVRGPLSRKYLVGHGVECPEVYGDPAILLSRYYRPASTKKRYKIGIIPHYTDKKNPLLDLYRQEDSVYIFDIQNYRNYKLLIDTLCACEFIISSSLHGLIISDSYGIPNLWVEFSSGVLGGRFKFEDYFLSVKRPLINMPIEIKSFKPVDELLHYQQDYQSYRLDLEELIKCCPFK